MNLENVYKQTVDEIFYWNCLDDNFIIIQINYNKKHSSILKILKDDLEKIEKQFNMKAVKIK